MRGEGYIPPEARKEAEKAKGSQEASGAEEAQEAQEARETDERSEGIFKRAQAAIDELRERIPDLATRRARDFAKTCMLLIPVMVGTLAPENASADNDPGWEAHANRWEKSVQSLQGLASRGDKTAARWAVQRQKELDDFRAEWMNMRQTRLEHVNLKHQPKDAQDYFEEFGVKVEESLIRDQTVIDEVRWSPLMLKYATRGSDAKVKQVNNILVAANGEQIAFTPETYRLRYEMPAPGLMDVLAFNIDGSVNVLKLDGGNLVDMQFYENDEFLPYKKYEKKKKKMQRRLRDSKGPLDTWISNL